MLAFCSALALAAVQSEAPPSATRAVSYQFVAFRSDPVNRLTVPIRINGRDHRFLIDTGAERTGISLELARTLGLETGERSMVTGFAGTRWVPSVALPRIEFARSPRTGISALAFSRDAIGADGFLGLDALSGKTVLFDFYAKQAVVRSTPLFDRMIGPTERAKIRTENGRLIFTRASAGGLPVEAMLDTGSSISVGNGALRRALEARGKLGPSTRIRVLAVTGELIWADYAAVHRLSVGGTDIRDLHIAFAEFAPFRQLGFADRPAMLLGMNALRRFDQVSIDFNSRLVRFTNRTAPSATYRRTS